MYDRGTENAMSRQRSQRSRSPRVFQHVTAEPLAKRIHVDSESSYEGASYWNSDGDSMGDNLECPPPESTTARARSWLTSNFQCGQLRTGLPDTWTCSRRPWKLGDLAEAFERISTISILALRLDTKRERERAGESRQEQERAGESRRQQEGEQEREQEREKGERKRGRGEEGTKSLRVHVGSSLFLCLLKQF